MQRVPPSFADFKAEGHLWITLARGQYYPDYLQEASALYKPYLEIFGRLVETSASSEHLFLAIASIREGPIRIQLARIFRKYVSPETPVEMLKSKARAKDTVARFGTGFRSIPEVQKAFLSRPIPDEALSAVLWEYRDRGIKGYNLTEQFFSLFRAQFPQLRLGGPERAGADVPMGKIFPTYPNPKRPIDFVIFDGTVHPNEEAILAVGLARYDSDRGGAQEDDRIGGYRNCADEILRFAAANSLNIKVIFLNDGPGLLLGSMWNDYATLEQSWPGKIMVLTLRMVPERLTLDWLLS